MGWVKEGTVIQGFLFTLKLRTCVIREKLVNLSVPVWAHNRDYITWTVYQCIMSLLYFSSAEVAHGYGSLWGKLLPCLYRKRNDLFIPSMSSLLVWIRSFRNKS